MKKVLTLLLASFALTSCAETYIGSYAVKRMVYKEAGYSAPPVTGKRKIGNPYTIMGQTYYPIPSSEGYRRKGIASWYGSDFHGKKTANGEIYNMYDMTAAHPTLPIPTYVRVTHLENGRSIIVRVNDRGPFLRGRAIDLSYAAASQLNMVDQGTAPVLLEALPTDGSTLRTVHVQTPQDVVTTAEKSKQTSRWTDRFSRKVKEVIEKPVYSLTNRAEKPAVKDVANLKPSEKVSIGAVKIYVQTGAYRDVSNALNERSKLLKSYSNVVVKEMSRNGKVLHRVRLGPIQSVNEADTLLNQVVQNGWSNARIVIE